MINVPQLGRSVDPDVRRAIFALVDALKSTQAGSAEIAARVLAIGNADQWTNPFTDPTSPPDLTNLVATATFSKVILTWDYPISPLYAFAKVYRAASSDFGTAVWVGNELAGLYTDDPPKQHVGATYYYWVRPVSPSLKEGNLLGPASATLADDPEYFLELLTGKITASQLYADLNARIDLIDGPESMVNSVAYKVAQEAIARAQAILDEHSAWTAAVESEAGTRQTADTNEAYARETLASQMRGTYEGTDLTQVTSGLFYQERTARTSGDDALAQQISLLYAGVGGGFDPYTTWYFDSTVEGWTGTDCTIAQSSGWVEQTAVSSAPATLEKTGLSITGSKYGTVKFRIKRLAGTGWGISVDYQYGGNWYTGIAATSQTLAVGDTTVVTLDFSGTAGWTGNTITGLRVKTSATTSDRFSFDWIAIGREGPAASVAALESEQTARATADSAETTARETLATQLRGSYAGTDVTQLTAGLIYSERQARSTADSSEVTARQALSAKLTGFNDPTGKSLSDLTSGLVYEEKSARATAVGAVASDLSTLSTTVGGHTTSISSLTTTTNGLSGQYTLKIDNNGFLSGWGLASESAGGTPFSQFIFQADRFSVINPNVAPIAATITRSGSVATAVTASAHGLTSNAYVVIAGADQREYNGTKQTTVVNTTTFTFTVSGTPATPATGSIKVGRAVVPFIVDGGVVYMDTLLLKNGTIKNAQIESVAADKLYTPSGTIAEAIIGVGHITDAMIGNTIQSTTYVAGSSGWYINKNGTVEFNGGTFRGTVVFGSSSSGYANISDRPKSLAEVNTGEGSKLTGIAAGATVGAPTGTYVGSTLAQTVEGNAANGATAYTGTAAYRNSSAPTNNAAFGTITSAQTADGNVVVTVPYTYVQGAVIADQLLIFVREGGGTVVASDPCWSSNAVSSSVKFTLKPSTTYTFGVQAVRRTEAGLSGTAIITSGSITTSAANFTGNLNGTAASTVVNNAASAITAWDRLNSWTKPSSTVIDGSKIMTGEAWIYEAYLRTAIVGTAHIKDAAVDTLQIKGNAVTVPVSASASASASAGQTVTAITSTLTTIGMNVAIWADMDSISGFMGESGPDYSFKLYRGTTLLKTWNDGGCSLYVDAPSAGTYTYYVKITAGAAGPCSATCRSFIMEVRR